MNYKLNPLFGDNFKDYTLGIRDFFSSSDETIHKARNELKIIDYNNTQTVVKSFKKPHILNRVVYSFFRETKAKKSYEYSLKIKNFTPNPISYIEFYEDSLLSDSYFISEKFEYDFTIREPLLDTNFPQRDAIFEAFAHFTYQLHEEGILHQDYSPGNILIQQENDKFIFKIVDINRMEFKRLSLDERLANFNKLWAGDYDIAIMLKEYAKISQENEEYCIKTAQFYNTKHKNKKNFKKRLKGMKVVD